MKAALLLLIRSVCVSLLLAMAVNAGVSAHHDGPGQLCGMSVADAAAHGGGTGAGETRPCDDDGARHAGFHCPAQGCAALVAEIMSLPAASPLARTVFAAARVSRRPLARAEGPDRPPDV